VSFFGNRVALRDGPNVDAFSRLRVSALATLFASQCQYGAEPLQLETGATGTGVAGVHSASNRMVALTVGAGTGTSFLQSHEYIPYQAGTSQRALIGGLIDTAVSGSVVDVGLFDASNGIFLRQNGTAGTQIVRRTNASGVVVNNVITQSAWSLDKLDGTGKSGFTLDLSKVFILVIDMQFSTGRVRVGFNIDGQIIYAHEFRAANVISLPSMQTFSLPVQMLVTATASTGPKTAYFKHAEVASEGGINDDVGYTFSTPEQTVTAGNGSATHILSIRPSTTFNSLVNRTKLRVNWVDIAVTGNSPVLWQLCIGSSFSVAPTYADVDATYSSTQYSSIVGTLSALGTIIASGYVAASGSTRGAVSAALSASYPITLDRAGATRSLGTLSLNVTGIGGTSASRAIMTFTEIR
jgi:hypothetical protein